MTLDVLKLAEIIGALTIVIGGLFAIFKFYENSKKQAEEIKHIKSEQTMTIYVLRACLDGLHQQGCNGKVTEAIDKLDKYINKAAHNDL